MMRMPYVAAFLVPIDTKKDKAEDGWEFRSELLVSSEVISLFIQVFNLRFKNTTLGVDYYEGTSFQMSVFHSEEDDLVEHLYFQLREGSLRNIRDVFEKSAYFKQYELFVPSEQ